jgi:hypothetical protein
VYALFPVVLVIFSVFVFAENITGDEIDNSSMLNYTNNSIVETTISQESSSLIDTILSMTLEKLSFNKGEIIKISTKLTTEDNAPIPNQDIYLLIGETSIGDSPTNDEGISTTYFDTSTTNPGQHIISAEYRGSEQYTLSFDYKQIEIVDESGETTQTPTNNEISDVSIQTEQSILEETPLITTQDTIDPDITQIQDCTQEKWTEKTPIYDTCTQTREQTTCSDEPINITCETKNISYDYQCITDYQESEKIKEICKTKSYVIKNKYKLDVDGYTCQTNKDNGNIVTMICDSIYDGNGDGICTSGESCIKYVISNNTFNKYEKNSKDEFIQEDDSYFLPKTTEEVLQ